MPGFRRRVSTNVSSIESLSRLSAGEFVLRAIILLVTLPYHRFFTNNTLKPTEEILQHAQQLHPPVSTSTNTPATALQHNKKKLDKITKLLMSWGSTKRHELEFVSIAGVAITAIVTASIAWSNSIILVFGDDMPPHWMAAAWWFASLILSTIGILLSAQQISILTLIGKLHQPPANDKAPTPDDEKLRRRNLRIVERHLLQLLTAAYVVPEESSPVSPSGKPDLEVGRNTTPEIIRKTYKLSYKMLLTWQIPTMFAAYGFISYFIGLSILVFTPILRGAPRGSPPWCIAVCYAAVSGFAWGLFVYCSLGGYRRMPVDQEEAEDLEEDEDDGGSDE